MPVLSKDCCFSLHGEQGYFFLLFSLCWSPPALTHCPSSSIITPYLCPTSTTPIKFDQLTEDCSGDFTHAFSSAFTRRFRLLLGQCTSGLHYILYIPTNNLNFRVGSRYSGICDVSGKTYVHKTQTYVYCILLHPLLL